MNKTKMILTVLGGGFGLAIIVAAYFVWSAYSAKTAAIEGDEEEGTAGRDGVVERAHALSQSAVYPCAASVKAIEANTAGVVAWKGEAAKLAARGDCAVRKTTPAQFKTDIVEDAKRLMSLPGTATGKFAKPDFAFGPFRPYVAEGKMPSEAELTTLVRQWDDIVKVVETLAACGVGEIVDVQIKAASSEDEAKAEEAKKRGKRAKRASAKADKGEGESKAVSYSYVFTFNTRAPGLVKAVNALATGERFIVIDNFTFVRERDVIADALGGDEKKAAEAAMMGGGGGRRRRGRDHSTEKKKIEGEEEKGKNSIITDPLLDAPMKVELTLTVYDFGTQANATVEATAAAGEKKAEEKKGEAKK